MTTLFPELLHRVDACWRAANYLSVGQIYLFAARGFRSLGVARSEGNDQWQFLGVLPLFDPPREDPVGGGARHADRGDLDCGLRAVYDSHRLGWAGFVWGYVLLWFLLNDRVKLLTCRIFDPIKT